MRFDEKFSYEQEVFDEWTRSVTEKTDFNLSQPLLTRSTAPVAPPSARTTTLDAGGITGAVQSQQPTPVPTQEDGSHEQQPEPFANDGNQEQIMQVTPRELEQNSCNGASAGKLIAINSDPKTGIGYMNEVSSPIIEKVLYGKREREQFFRATSLRTCYFATIL